jgi:pyruvate kinase
VLVCARRDYQLTSVGDALGTQAKLVAKYRPGVPVLMVCIADSDSDEDKKKAARIARAAMTYRGLVPIVVPPDCGAANLKETMKKALAFAIERRMVFEGDLVVGLHKVEEDAVMKIVTAHKAA